MTLDQIVLPELVHKEVENILDGIAEADSLLELTHLGGMADGFAIGLKCGMAVGRAEIDELEVVFARAFENRMEGLRRS